MICLFKENIKSAIFQDFPAELNEISSLSVLSFFFENSWLSFTNVLKVSSWNLCEALEIFSRVSFLILKSLSKLIKSSGLDAGFSTTWKVFNENIFWPEKFAKKFNELISNL